MFFSISKSQDHTFPNHLVKNNYNIDYDNGWTYTGDFLYKGLTQYGLLKINNPDDVEFYKKQFGTFCILDFRNNKIEIIYGTRQKFPQFITNNRVTNLYKTGKSVDGKITITDKIDVEYTVDMHHTPLALSDEQVISAIDKILDLKIKQFQEPLKIYPTGVDSLLLIAYVLKNKMDYELIQGEHAEMDHFLCYHRTYLQKTFWAYQTIQHYRQPTVLLTGGHGDEMLLRDPLQAFLFLKHKGENLVEVCEKNPQYYMSWHMLKPECRSMYEKYADLHFDKDQNLKSYILNIFRTDYQHWHLGNTLFLSPLDDIELLDIMLNLSYDTMRKQMLESYVSKELIRRNRPGLLNLISNIKNVNYYENLTQVFDGKVKLEDL